jgi:uncharacterized membrane protein
MPREGDMIEATVTIGCRVEEVFRFYRDFRNLPSFLGDVMEVEQLGPMTSRWTIQGPLGIRVSWTVRVTEERANELIRYETIAPSALRTRWVIHFARGRRNGESEVREEMKVPLGRVGGAALALIGKDPREEVSSNLHRLKEIMEEGRVTDTRHSVAGKFAQRPVPLFASRKRRPEVGKAARRPRFH